MNIGGWTAWRIDGENREGVLEDTRNGVWSVFAEEDEVAGAQELRGIVVDDHLG